MFWVLGKIYEVSLGVLLLKQVATILSSKKTVGVVSASFNEPDPPMATTRDVHQELHSNGVKHTIHISVTTLFSLL